VGEEFGVEVESGLGGESRCVAMPEHVDRVSLALAGGVLPGCHGVLVCCQHAGVARGQADDGGGKAAKRSPGGALMASSETVSDVLTCHDLAAEKRRHDLCAGEVPDRAGERVTVDDDEVGVMAGFE
jgi:hypothetical protein